MASYYYLVASLPMLRFDEDPPITRDQFLQSCHAELPSDEYTIIEQLSSGQVVHLPKTSGYLNTYQEIQRKVLESLHRNRARKLSRTEPSESENALSDVMIEDLVKQAMQAEHPLAAELLLMRFFWDTADSLKQMRIFSIEVLYAYAIQLALLERKSLFTPLEGNAEFKRLFSNLQSIIKSI